MSLGFLPADKCNQVRLCHLCSHSSRHTTSKGYLAFDYNQAEIKGSVVTKKHSLKIAAVH